jgi:hypothetical protein
MAVPSCPASQIAFLIPYTGLPVSGSWLAIGRQISYIDPFLTFESLQYNLIILTAHLKIPLVIASDKTLSVSL